MKFFYGNVGIDLYHPYLFNEPKYNIDDAEKFMKISTTFGTLADSAQKKFPDKNNDYHRRLT